jgi:hypothetical protein
MPELFTYSFDPETSYIHAVAYVEDMIQVSPATRFDPPEYGTALCSTDILWSDDATPTQKEVIEALDDVIDWDVVDD